MGLRVIAPRETLAKLDRAEASLYEAHRIQLTFGGGWGAGFTVASDRPDVFLAPTEPWEQGYAPDQWAGQVADAGRLWYLGTWFLGRAVDPVYRALTTQGWTPVREFDAQGGFLVLMTGGGTPAERLLDVGLRAQRAGDMRAAFETYHAVVQKDPTNPVAYYDLGLVDAAAGGVDTAVADYRTAIFYNPTYTPAMFNLAALLRQGQPDQAVALYRRILSVKPADADTELNLGLLLMRTGSADEGRAHVRRAIQADPSLAAQVPPGTIGP